MQAQGEVSKMTLPGHSQTWCASRHHAMVDGISHHMHVVGEPKPLSLPYEVSTTLLAPAGVQTQPALPREQLLLWYPNTCQEP